MIRIKDEDMWSPHVPASHLHMDWDEKLYLMNLDPANTSPPLLAQSS